jgi:hypothetical protein
MFSEEFLSEDITEREAIERLGLQAEFGVDGTLTGRTVTDLKTFIEELLQEEMFTLSGNLGEWLEKREAAGEDIRRYKCNVCCGDEGGPDALCSFHRNGSPVLVEVLV